MEDKRFKKITDKLKTKDSTIIGSFHESIVLCEDEFKEYITFTQEQKDIILNMFKTKLQWECNQFADISKVDWGNLGK